MPPLVVVALGALGVAALTRVIAAGLRGASAIDPSRTGRTAPPEGEVIQLVRDPVTGEYRPVGR